MKDYIRLFNLINRQKKILINEKYNLISLFLGIIKLCIIIFHAGETVSIRH